MLKGKMHCSLTCTNTTVYHTQLKSFILHSGITMHSNKHSFNMFISFSLTEFTVAEVKMDRMTYLKMNLFRKQLRRCNVPPNHRPACSLISQQHRHPRAGHDSPRNKGTSRLTHSQGYTKHTTKPTELGLSGHWGGGEGKLLSRWAHYRAKDTYTRTSLTSKTPIHAQHKESVPSLLHSPSGPAFPSSAIQGWWRRRPAL